MNTKKTKALVQRNNVVTLRADKTQPAPEVDELLVKLGNTGKAIPFVAIFPAGGGEPILMDGFITQNQVLEALKEAGPSRGGASTAMK